MKKVLLFLSFIASSLLLAATESPTFFVILVMTYNNAWKDHKGVVIAEENIRSVFLQEYENFKVLVVDDASTDDTGEIIKRVAKELGKEDKLIYVRNAQRKGAMENMYTAVHSYVVDPQAVIIICDGDDALADPSVLSYLDELYRTHEPELWLTYGQYREKLSGNVGFNEPMPEMVVKNNAFRQWTHIPSHLRTFKAWLFRQIRKQDLMYNGAFFEMTADMASMIPMIEMASRGHFAFVDKVLLYYNDGNPWSDHRKSKKVQRQTDLYIRRLPVYRPL